MRHSRWGRDLGGRSTTGENAVPFTRSNGLDHDVTMRLKSPATTTLAGPPPEFVASQRVRVTLWVQDRRKVPFSSSRGEQRRAPEDAEEQWERPGSRRRVVGAGDRSEELACHRRTVVVRRARFHRRCRRDGPGAARSLPARWRSPRAGRTPPPLGAKLAPGQPDHLSIAVSLTQDDGGPHQKHKPAKRRASTRKIAVRFPGRPRIDWPVDRSPSRDTWRPAW